MVKINKIAAKKKTVRRTTPYRLGRMRARAMRALRVPKQIRKKGWAALHYAVYGGHPEVVRLLLENGANVNHVDAGGRTPLWIASWKGHEKVVQRLIAGGADVNHKTNMGYTSLFAASASGHAEVVGQLIAAGADVNK